MKGARRQEPGNGGKESESWELPESSREKEKAGARQRERRLRASRERRSASAE